MPYHYNQSNKVSCAFKRELFFGCFCTMKTPAYYINVLYCIQKGFVNALFFEYNIEFSHYILTTENRAFFYNNINSFRHHLIIKYFCNKKVLFIGANPVKKLELFLVLIRGFFGNVVACQLRQGGPKSRTHWIEIISE